MCPFFYSSPATQVHIRTRLLTSDCLLQRLLSVPIQHLSAYSMAIHSFCHAHYITSQTSTVLVCTYICSVTRCLNHCLPVPLSPTPSSTSSTSSTTDTLLTLYLPQPTQPTHTQGTHTHTQCTHTYTMYTLTHTHTHSHTLTHTLTHTHTHSHTLTHTHTHSHTLTHTHTHTHTRNHCTAKLYTLYTSCYTPHYIHLPQLDKGYIHYHTTILGCQVSCADPEWLTEPNNPYVPLSLYTVTYACYASVRPTRFIHCTVYDILHATRTTKLTIHRSVHD